MRKEVGKVLEDWLESAGRNELEQLETKTEKEKTREEVEKVPEDWSERVETSEEGTGSEQGENNERMEAREK